MTADQQNAGWVADALRVHEEQAREEEARGTRHGSPQPLPGTVREELVLERIDRARRSRPRVKEERITMSHGAGGKATQTLIEAIFLDEFRNPLLEPLEDELLADRPRQRLRRAAPAAADLFLEILFLTGPEGLGHPADARRLSGHDWVASLTRVRVRRP